MVRPLSALVGAIMVLTVGCSAPSGSENSTETVTAESTTESFGNAGATTEPSAPVSFPSNDDFAQLVRATAGGDHPEGSALDSLWTGILGATPHGYESPAEVVGYRGGIIPDSPCAAGTTARFWEQNAFYCEGDQTILYDEAWLRDFSSRFGAFAPAAILAHEWGHHIQTFLGGFAYSIQFELQADCLAGMYLAASEQVSPGVFLIGGDLPAALQTFFDIGNSEYDAGEWFSAAEHGSPVQRMMAFGTGYLAGTGMATQSLTWCAGYRDFIPQDFAEIGPYRLLNLPGRVEAWKGASYQIAGNAQTGMEMSDIALTWREQVPLPDQKATLDQLHELWRIDYPDIVALAEPIDPPKVGNGPVIAHYFEIRATQPDGSLLIQSGVFTLVSPADGSGGLIVLITRDEPPPTDLSDPAQLAMLDEQLSSVYQVANRLCGPDESGDTGNPVVNVTCLDEQ